MAPTPHDHESGQTPTGILYARLAFTYVVILLTLWVPAWDVGWWQAWVYSAALLAAGLGGRLWAESRHPGLTAERQSLDKAREAKSWDKVLAPLMAVSISVPLFLVAGLDHRFGWSPIFPVWLNILGLALLSVGYAIGVWALVENRFFSTTVRIQSDRGHVVCDTGPYRFVRHPGYAGNLLPLVGIPLALDSLWTFIPAVVAFGIAVVRTSLEDRTLQEELPGYREYAQRVRYRLIPGIY